MKVISVFLCDLAAQSHVVLAQPLIIGGRPPILNQMQVIKMIRKIDCPSALLKGLQYLLRFSPKGIINKTPGK